MLGERRSKAAFSAGFAERVQEQPHENSGHLQAEIWKEEDPDFEEIMEDGNETEENRPRDFFGGEDGADLKGKTIYASGKGSTPEYALDYILSANGIDPEKDVTIEWKSEHSECVAAISRTENGIAMLPQPFVTTAQTKNPAIRTALDLTEEWEKVQSGEDTKSSMITGVVVARTEFVEEHPQAVEDFLEHYEDSVEYVNENTKEAAQLVGKYDIVTAEIAEKALPECNIVYMDGEDMKEQLSGYLEVLKNQNPQAVGGAVPGDDFYYIEK